MTRFEIEPFAAPLGAELRGFPFDRFTALDIAEVRRAWITHQVLRFRGSEISDEDQIRFSKALGVIQLNPHQRPGQPGAHACHPEILVISNRLNADGTPAGDLGNNEVDWHTDSYAEGMPPIGTTLRALTLPPSGGNTYFCDMYAAFESLSQALRTAIEGRKMHHQIVYDIDRVLRIGMQHPQSDDIRTWPGIRRPIVQQHPESGRRCLYLGSRRRDGWIVDLPLDESQAIVAELWRHATSEERVCVQIWQRGDMLLWDNRCVMHRRDALSPAFIRVLHRTTIAAPDSP
jgi:taurine dioxygenase